MSFFEGNPLQVKICGLTNETDAGIAVEAGADALGFNFFPGSKRFLELAPNRTWLEKLAGRVKRVAVVVNASAEELHVLRDSGCFEAVQFHGDESPEFCAASPFPVWIRAIRVKDGSSLQEALRYETPFLLLDAWSSAGYGGTGARLDWDMVRSFTIANADRKIILAGGLTPTNVRDAVRISRPYGVDVASGVELEPGRKNEYLVREFIKVARAA